MRYSHTVTMLDPVDGTLDLGPMSKREAEDLAGQLVRAGYPATVVDRHAALAERFPKGATVVHSKCGRRAVVTPERAGSCPVSLEPDYDPDTPVWVAVDHDGTEMVRVRGEVNGWFGASVFTLTP